MLLPRLSRRTSDADGPLVSAGGADRSIGVEDPTLPGEHCPSASGEMVNRLECVLVREHDFTLID